MLLGNNRDTCTHTPWNTQSCPLQDEGHFWGPRALNITQPLRWPGIHNVASSCVVVVPQSQPEQCTGFYWSTTSTHVHKHTHTHLLTRTHMRVRACAHTHTHTHYILQCSWWHQSVDSTILWRRPSQHRWMCGPCPAAAAQWQCRECTGRLHVGCCCWLA